MRLRTLSFYYSNKTTTYDEIKTQVRDLAYKHGVTFLPVLVDGDHELEKRFTDYLPTILIGPYQLNFPFTTTEIEVAILSTLDRDKQLQAGKGEISIKYSKMSKLEHFSLWFSNQYPIIITIFLFLYILIPFLAPILQKNGDVKIASAIYKVYSILCHQLAFRSYFIDGEQPIYPRILANVKGFLTYEEVTGYSAEDIVTARNFIGNDKLGYKVALCERDLAIYGSMALVGIIFFLKRKSFRRIPWIIWIIVAIIPIALDGLSQLPGLSSNWPAWMPNRESTPLLRTITGMLFGGGTAWFMYPLIEDTVKETRFQLQRKLQVVKYFDGKKNPSLRDQEQ